MKLTALYLVSCVKNTVLLVEFMSAEADPEGGFLFVVLAPDSTPLSGQVHSNFV